MIRRVFPHNLDAEASILGGILLRNDVLAQLDAIESDDFYDMRHKIVFGAIRALEAAGKPIDVVTLENEIEKQGKLDAIGGVAFLGELALRVPTPDNVDAYAEIVRDKAIARRLMLTASEILERGFEDDLDVGDYLDGAERRMLEVTARRSRSDEARPIGVLAQLRAREHEQLVAARARGDVALTGVPTGIAGLDRRLGGWQFEIVNLLAARPGMGKTATATATADAATAGGYGCHQFVLEDGWRALVDRAFARASKVSAEALRRGDIDAARGDVRALADALMRLVLRKNWYIDDRAGLTASEIVRSVRRMRKEIGTRIVIIDYVQLVRRRRGLSENEAIDEIITELATAAKEDGLCYLVLSQLNRKVEERVDKRPQMSDLRGSGALEERPKIVVLQYRGAYYHDDPQVHVDYDCDCPSGSRMCPHVPTDEQFQRSVQLIVGKNNMGPTGRVFASWRGETTEIW